MRLALAVAMSARAWIRRLSSIVPVVVYEVGVFETGVFVE